MGGGESVEVGSSERGGAETVFDIFHGIFNILAWEVDFGRNEAEEREKGK